ncbi:MAG: alanyl-tRNA editing protein [Thermoplasmatota archaeon]
MTDLLWMPAVDARLVPRESNPNYIRSFDATVQKTLEDWLILDRTAFYAEGGGQPSDVGKLTWDGGEAAVKHVSKKGAVKHVIEGERPPAGARVHGDVDWALRAKHMRMHTSQHILSGVVWRHFQAPTVGNQIHADFSRVDFTHKFSDAELRDIESEINEILARDVPVRIYEEDRAAIEAHVGDRALLKLVPQSVKRLRIVEIVDTDYCPCAGTHVASTREIGKMEITGRETKGADADRVTYVLK